MCRYSIAWFSGVCMNIWNYSAHLRRKRASPPSAIFWHLAMLPGTLPSPVPCHTEIILMWLILVFVVVCLLYSPAARGGRYLLAASASLGSLTIASGAELVVDDVEGLGGM